MSNDSITVRGALKINNIPELACFTTFVDLLKALPDYFSVEVPKTITNVVVSNAQPSDSELGNLWVRTDNAGVIIGLYVFSSGAWVQVSPAPNEIIRMFGNSTNVPAGYRLIATGHPSFTGAEITAIQASWYPTPPQAVYTIFDVTLE